MEIKCCMVGCANISSKKDNGKVAFYVFPKDFCLCMLWVQNSGRPEYFEDFAFAGAQPFLNRHICSNHFRDIDFVKRDPKMGLLPGSVPHLNLAFQKFDVKEEIIEQGTLLAYSNARSRLVFESELLNEIKLEKIEDYDCDDVHGNLSFSSTDDSCNDLLGSKIPTPGTVDIYKETEKDKELSNEFFIKYKTAIRRRSNGRRPNETEEERTLRLKREALRAKIRRSQESEEQKKLRRMKNALRAAFRRQNETPEQRELRKKKDKLRSQRRRKAETETETRMRRYNDAVRAACRRNNESEEQKMERKMKDIIRAAKRRSLETPEQRAERLRKDRERASKRRMLKRITEQMTRIDSFSELDSITGTGRINYENPPHPLGGSIATTQCNETNNIDHLQQVLDFIENNSNKSNTVEKESPKINTSNLNRSINTSPLFDPTVKIPIKNNILSSSTYEVFQKVGKEIFN